MYINTSQGKVDIIEIDESTIQNAPETTPEWEAGEQVVLACLEGNDWKRIPVNEIVNYNPNDSTT